MKVVRYILSIILSFALVLAILAVVGTKSIESKILRKDYMISKMNEIEFYDQIAREVQDGFEEYIYQSGLPEDTIQGLFTKEMIKKDVDTIVNKMYDGTDIKLSTETVRQNLDSKVNQYLDSQNLKLNKQGKENITKFEDLVINEYDKNVNISDKVYDGVHSGIESIRSIMNKVGIIPIIVLIVIIIILIAINIKDLLLAMNYIGISLLSSGVLLNLATKTFFNNVNIDHLVILSDSVSSLAINIIKDLVYGIADNGKLLLVSGAILIIVSAITRNIGKNSEDNKKRKDLKNDIKEVSTNVNESEKKDDDLKKAVIKRDNNDSNKESNNISEKPPKRRNSK